MDGINIAANRIIPAYAGSTGRPGSWPARRRDHPRVCGEHQASDQWGNMTIGSSPRMRGARMSAVEAGCTAGIIPAYAGSTLLTYICLKFRGDHPRVCGEHRHGR